MERGKSVYNSKNILLLVGIFCIIFGLMYALGAFLHESRKINQEIESIRQENLANLEEIEAKKRHLAYLRTPQRVEKEAKIQIGRKRPNEKVLVFVEEGFSENIEPVRRNNSTSSESVFAEEKSDSHWRDWWDLFFRPKR